LLPQLGEVVEAEVEKETPLTRAKSVRLEHSRGQLTQKNTKIPWQAILKLLNTHRPTRQPLF
jgi:hypothetical protein